ncbi:unnamed protein product [Blepharisma stoltei]|uniref:Uncharacterized protein n=1 Tax=Blepharisma stoltei TaxID=1481888 RepID=A0AAU9ISQ1_9CILI|nr:unnamed protein product [Blepharisma stoltei]
MGCIGSNAKVKNPRAIDETAQVPVESFNEDRNPLVQQNAERSDHIQILNRGESLASNPAPQPEKDANLSSQPSLKGLIISRGSSKDPSKFADLD